MSLICPTVTAYDKTTFKDQLALVGDFAERIHIDLMDGDFAPTKSPKLDKLLLDSDKKIDIHVMYRNPDKCINDLIAIRPNLVIIHHESNADVSLFATNMREHGVQTGLAILPETSVEDIWLLLPHVQHVLIFGGHLGYHGGDADLSQLEKAMSIKKSFRNIEIGWDGGANLNNAQQIKQAGVDVINVGNDIHSSPDPKSRYIELNKLVA